MDLLKDILVVDFSRYLAGPSATLKLADFGARVIKIEKPGVGDPYRDLFFGNVKIGDMSSAFCSLNRNKESFEADLKNAGDHKMVEKLIAKADVVVHNFRPGVAEKLGVGYEDIRKINDEVVYASISGYGDKGPWKDKPGQDLLVQAISGVTMLSGNAGKGPVPLGLAMADVLAGAHLAQGILAALVQKGKDGTGCKVSVNMLESMLDLQFETVTTYYHDGGASTERTASNNAHAYLGAPYGVYETQNGHLALAMGAIPVLGELLGCSGLLNYPEPESWFSQRDEIKKTLADHLKKDTTEKWLSILEPADIWCADVMDWDRLFAHDGFKALDMLQEVVMSNGVKYQTTRCPVKIDGEVIKLSKGAPEKGENAQSIIADLL